MASTNKHWPSLFKSKPCNAHHQWQHDINPYHQKTSYTSGGTCEERSPEPKPRWNPKPEQIRILEAIFNSGMVNPPRDEIRKIRAQLQEYGQVGDANVFYWFQNRKSRSKHKQRQLQTTRSQSRSASAAARGPVATSCAAATATSSSSSSSEQSSGSDKNLPSVASITVGLASASPTPSAPVASLNPMYFQSPFELGSDSFLFQSPQGLCISPAELTNIVGAPEHVSSLSPVLWSDFMGHHQEFKNGEDEAKAKNMQLHHEGYGIDTSPAVVSAASSVAVTSVVAAVGTAATIGAPATATVASPIHVIQGLGLAGLGVSCNNGGVAPAAKSTVFINEVAFQVSTGPFNVREAFGEDAVLLHSSGHPVLTDEWGVTIHPLQHGSSYYLV